MKRQNILAALALACAPAISSAHTEGSAEGLISGLLHPVFGVDHFLAMLSVGIVSVQLGGKRVLAVPAIFVAAMIVGALFGILGLEWPMVEIGIAASVVVLGVMMATTKETTGSLPVMAVTAFFGSLHGHAHGLEMPNAASPVFYAGGFVISTASIHLLGVGLGHLLKGRRWSASSFRPIGVVMAALGVMILVRSSGLAG